MALRNGVRGLSLPVAPVAGTHKIWSEATAARPPPGKLGPVLTELESPCWPFATHKLG